MKHVPPHRFADGSASAKELAHAATCVECQRARARVEAAGAALTELREGAPPQLQWDRLGAQLYWSASSELRKRARDREGGRDGAWLIARRALAVALGTAVALAAVVVVLLRPRTADAPAPAPLAAAPIPARPAPVHTSEAPVPAPAPGPPSALESVVVFLQGDVRLGDDRVTLQSTIHAGDVLRTQNGRLAVQFGAGSGFVLEPMSTLAIESWDSASVALRVDGAVSVEVEERRPGQTFAVIAGERAVEVRGTIFRVAHHAGDLDVAVRRGKVAVVEGDASVEVAAGARLALSRAARLGSIPPEAMLPPASDALAESMRVPLVPGSLLEGGADAMRGTSATVAVTAPPRARVRVDGVDVGAGSFQLRAAPGRHLVESGTVARWVELEAGAAAATSVGTMTRSERPGQLDGQLRAHRADVFHCAEPERKAAPGFEGQVEVEIGIAADGSVNFVSAVGRTLYPAVEACLLDVLRDQLTFPAGTQATVRKVISF